MLKILDPTAGPVSGKLVLAPRFDTLNGVKIGVIWNGKPYGDNIIRGAIGLLKEKYTFDVVDFLKKPYIGNVAPKEFFAKLAADKAQGAPDYPFAIIPEPDYDAMVQTLANQRELVLVVKAVADQVEAILLGKKC